MPTRGLVGNSADIFQRPKRAESEEIMGKKDVRRVDVFGMSAEMRERVARFMTCKVNGVELKNKYDALIRTYETVLKDKSNPDRVWINEDAKAIAVAAAQKDLDDTVSLYKKLKDTMATFDYSDFDKTFKKSWKNAVTGSDRREAVRTWAKALNLDIAASDLENRIMGALAGKDVNNTKNFVNSGNNNTDARKEGVALKLMYGEVADYMVEKGLSLPIEFSEELKKKYAPKKKNQ